MPYADKPTFGMVLLIIDLLEANNDIMYCSYSV